MGDSAEKQQSVAEKYFNAFMNLHNFVGILDTIELPEKMVQELQAEVADGGGKYVLEGLIVSNTAAQLAAESKLELQVKASTPMTTEKKEMAKNLTQPTEKGAKTTQGGKEKNSDKAVKDKKPGPAKGTLKSF